ncbi:hypothetical protein ACJX0J_011993, partial [Zea mays]
FSFNNYFQIWELHDHNLNKWKNAVLVQTCRKTKTMLEQEQNLIAHSSQSSL